MELLLDFLNLKNMDFPGIKSLFERHQIYNASNMLRGQSLFFDLFDDEISLGKAHYSLFSERQVRAGGFSEEDHFFKRLVFPEDQRYEQAFKVLRLFQLEIKDFVDSCLKGRPELEYIRAIVKEHDVFALDLAESEDVWKPTLKVYTHPSTIFQFHLRSKEILYPFLCGEGIAFSKIKACKNCGKYYVPKSAKSVFCNNACKNDYHYKIAH